MKTKSKYLIIEPYVYCQVNKNEALFYNTISGGYYKLTNPVLLDKLKKSGFRSSSSIIDISTEIIDSEDFKFFITEIRKLFIGDVLEASEAPFLFNNAPILNNTSENNMDGEINRNITESLFEINIYTNSLVDNSINFENAYKQFLFPRISTNKKQLQNHLITKLVSEIDNYYNRNINLVIGNLNEMNIDISAFKMNQSIINGYLYYKTILKATELDLLESFENLYVYIDSGIKEEKLILLKEKLSHSINKVTFQLIIESEGDYEKLEKLQTFYDLKSTYKPYFNANTKFFEENIFITEEEVFQRKLSLNEIHQRLLINSSNYGKLYITEEGNVHSNLNKIPLGNLATQNIKELVQKELSDEQSCWKKTRNSISPCRNCILNGLCPSISNYEYAYGKYNLCHVTQ